MDKNGLLLQVWLSEPEKEEEEEDEEQKKRFVAIVSSKASM